MFFISLSEVKSLPQEFYHESLESFDPECHEVRAAAMFLILTSSDPRVAKYTRRGCHVDVGLIGQLCGIKCFLLQRFKDGGFLYNTIEKPISREELDAGSQRSRPPQINANDMGLILEAKGLYQPGCELWAIRLVRPPLMRFSSKPVAHWKLLMSSEKPSSGNE